MWHQKYSLPCTKVLGLISCRIVSKVLGIGAAKPYWDYVNSIKSDKISAIRSDVQQKQSIVYTSACIEAARIKQYHYDKNLTEKFSSHTWNEDDDDFDQ